MVKSNLLYCWCLCKRKPIDLLQKLPKIRALDNMYCMLVVCICVCMCYMCSVYVCGWVCVHVRVCFSMCSQREMMSIYTHRKIIIELSVFPVNK